MPNKFLTILLVGLCIALHSFAQPERKLAQAFVQSIAKNDFKLLAPYMINAASAKKIFATEFSKIPVAKQAATIKNFNKTLHDKWKVVVANAKKNKADFTKVKTGDVKLQVVNDADMYSSVLVTYIYNDLEWDDLLLFVNRKGTQKYLMELPANTYMFAFDEQRRGRNLQEFETSRDDTAKVKAQLQREIEQIRGLASTGEESLLAAKIVYRGDEDKATRWKRPLNPNNAADMELAREWITKAKKTFTGCTDLNFGNVRIEKESEGKWYVLQVTCGSKKFHYAFLKVNGAFLLGDIDSHD